jgi:enamine deaminase RidA (YjgF/YER057c/UK114 family)
LRIGLITGSQAEAILSPYVACSWALDTDGERQLSQSRQHVFSGSVYEEMAGYSRACIVGDHIYVSGTVGVDFSSGEMAVGPEAQTNTALDTIEKALVEAKSSLTDIVRVRVYVPDADHVMAVSTVLKSRLGDTRPANTTICSPLAVPGAHVEIEVEAMRDSAVVNSGV